VAFLFQAAPASAGPKLHKITDSTFQGTGSLRLADSTAAATGTTFDLDDDNCATNVQPVGDDWTDVSTGFAELANSETFLVNLIYDSGGSGNRAGKVRIDQSQIGRPYGTKRVSPTRCTTSPGALYSEPSIIAHELGHAYALYSHLTPGSTADTRIAIGWENTVHGARGKPMRSFQCH
jgi:hypothetical protein